MAKKLQTIYEYFGEYGYKKDNVDLAISMLDEEEKELIKLRYGEDLENPQTSIEWNKDHQQKYYGALIPRIKRILTNIQIGKPTKKQRKKKEIIEKIEELPINSKQEDTKIDQPKDLITENTEIQSVEQKIVEETKEPNVITEIVSPTPLQNQIDLFSFLRSASFLEITNELSVKEAIIICLRLGYVDDKYYETKTIANFFNISEDEVRSITKKALNLYKEKINSVIDQVIIEQNSKISENNSSKPQILCKTPTNNSETS